MAQQPKKIAWKEKKPYGLSASQFGDALGFGGLIWDYVDYRRKCIGTELEFTGNAATAHGIRTEDKSRSLYELLTGTQVHDGSFFLSDNGLLGCSPDGRIFVDNGERDNDAAADDMVAAQPGGPSPRFSSSVSGLLSTSSEEALSPLASPSSFYQMTANGKVAVQNAVCSVPLPRVSGKRRRTFSPPRRAQNVRLLEIKSPVNSLYNGSYEKCKPFGIPLSYMCQMQGQMSISKTDECDFFVFLNQPLCECVCWRVRRSEAFWKWAEPKLLQAVYWIQHGQPDWLERDFKYKPFDFSLIEVAPIVFPFNFTDCEPLTSARLFPFFQNFTSPFLCAAEEEEGVKKDVAFTGKCVDTSTGGVAQTPPRPSTASKNEALLPSADSAEGQKRIATVAQLPIVRYLFDVNSDHLFGLCGEDEHALRVDANETAFFIECSCRVSVVYQHFAQDAMSQLHMSHLLEDLQFLTVASPYECIRVILQVPYDFYWSRGQVRVYVSLLDDDEEDCGGNRGTENMNVGNDDPEAERTCAYVKIRLYEQSFFQHLTVIKGFFATAADDDYERVRNNPFLSPRRWQEREREETHDAGGTSATASPAPSPAALCSQPLVTTVNEEALPLSQQIRLSLTPVQPTRQSSREILSLSLGRQDKEDDSNDVLYLAVTPDDLSDTLVRSKEWTDIYFCNGLWETTRLFRVADLADREACTLFIGPREALATFLDVAFLEEENCLTENALLLHVRSLLVEHKQTVRVGDEEVPVLDKKVTFCFVGESVKAPPTAEEDKPCPFEVLENLAIVPRISLFLGTAPPSSCGGSYLAWLDRVLCEQFEEHPIGA